MASCDGDIGLIDGNRFGHQGAAGAVQSQIVVQQQFAVRKGERDGIYTQGDQFNFGNRLDHLLAVQIRHPFGGGGGIAEHFENLLDGSFQYTLGAIGFFWTSGYGPFLNHDAALLENQCPALRGDMSRRLIGGGPYRI